MIFILVIFICIFSFLVNFQLFCKIFSRASIKSIFNTSQSVYFLYSSLIAPALILCYYYVISSKNDLQSYLQFPIIQETLDNFNKAHRANCWLYFFSRPIAMVPGLTVTYCNIVYRYLYVTMAS